MVEDGTHDATRWRYFVASGGEKPPHIRFYETNPPFLEGKSGVICLQ